MTYTSVCPPDHKHQATTTCYTKHKCRCEGCHTAWRARDTRIRKAIAYGRYVSPLIDATESRTHILHLRSAGLASGAIAHASGVDATTILKIADGRSQQVIRSTAAKILTVERDSDKYRPKSWYPATGSRRRLQALVARGWSLSALGREAGLSPQRIQQIINATRITVGVHRRIAALYDELWNERPPLTTTSDKGSYTKALNMARRRGWAPPAAWDDIDTDPELPTTVDAEAIDEVAVDLALAGEPVQLNHAEKLEGLRRMHPLKWSNSLIGEHLGCEERTVCRLRDELDLPGWDQNEVLDRRAA